MSARRFTMADQITFAELSGDRNPLHLDPIAARRSMIGGVAVHGIHLVLWALDELAAQRAFSAFSRLRVHFDRGATVDEDVSLDWHEDGDRLVGRLSGEAGTLARIAMIPVEGSAGHWSGPDGPNALECEAHDIGELSARSGELPLTLPPAWRMSFPHLAGRFAERQVAVLLAGTRLVGMVCPGLHSILSSVQLEGCVDPSPEAALHYHVVRADSRVRLVDMAVRGAGLRGSVSAFVRPPPYRQPALAALQNEVASDAFAGQRAIVIGGSRGLGELTAKLLCAGGAAVTITWRQGESEAQAIAAEATRLGRTIEVMPFDVAAPPEDPPPGDRYTHLYYFATPRIAAGRPGHFEPALFARMLGVYVTGLARCATWFALRSRGSACLWYPSTIFLERPDPHFAEYTAAKACGEALCAELSTQLVPLRIVVERLPRLATDQTQALADLPIDNGIAALRTALLRSVSE